MTNQRIWTAEDAEGLRLNAGAPTFWEWSIHAGRHPAHLYADGEFERRILVLDRDRVHAGVADLIAAAPELAASVVHHAKRADEAERQRDRLAEMLVKRSQDALRWRLMSEGESPSASFLVSWWRNSGYRDALVKLLGADAVERAEVNCG